MNISAEADRPAAPDILSVSKNGIHAITGLLLGLLIIAGMFLILPQSAESMISIFRNLKSAWPAVMMGIFLIFAGFVMRGWRWVQLISIPRNYLFYLAGYGLSQFWVVLLPARAGELARPLWFSKQGEDMKLIISSVVLERMFDAFFLLIILLAGSNIYFMRGLPGLDQSLLVTMLVISAVLFGVSLLYIRKKLQLNDIGWLRPGRGIIFACVSVLAWAIHAAGFYIILNSLGVAAGFGFVLVLLAAVNLASVFSIAPANMGPYEAVGTLLLFYAALASGQELMVMLVLHTASILGLLVFVLLSWACLVMRDRHALQQNHLQK